MKDCSKKKQALEYFASIMDELKQTKVKAIFSFSYFWERNAGFRRCNANGEIYIMLETGMCLVVDCCYLDQLNVQLRRLTKEEEDEYSELIYKDFFNVESVIHDFYTNRVKSVETCALEYDCITAVLLRSAKCGRISPEEDTFNEIKFTMKNGKSFVICADGAEEDDYIMFWSEDAKETISEINEVEDDEAE